MNLIKKWWKEYKHKQLVSSNKNTIKFVQEFPATPSGFIPSMTYEHCPICGNPGFKAGRNDMTCASCSYKIDVVAIRPRYGVDGTIELVIPYIYNDDWLRRKLAETVDHEQDYINVWGPSHIEEDHVDTTIPVIKPGNGKVIMKQVKARDHGRGMNPNLVTLDDHAYISFPNELEKAQKRHECVSDENEFFYAGEQLVVNK